MNCIDTKYLVIGGGITGLSFSNFINDDDVLIIEKEIECGGFCRSIKKDGFTWDYAGHFFHFSDDNLKKFFMSRIPESEFIFREKDTKIFYKNCFIDYPFQKNIHQLPKADFIDCLYYLYFKEEKSSYNSFKDMLYGKFGAGITDKFLRPYNEKLYACDLDSLDVNAMGRFFPYADLEDIISNMKEVSNNSYNNSFLYPRNGATVFVDALLESVDDDKILLDEVVVNVDIVNKIVTTSKRFIKYEYLINTIPITSFINTLEDKSIVCSSPDLTANKVLVFNLGFDRGTDIKNHWIYVPQKDINFYRVGFYNNILDNEDRMSLYVEIGFSTDDVFNVNDELEKVLKGLKEMKILTDQKLISYDSIVMNPAYVHVSQESDIFINKIKEDLMAHNVFSIGRYGGWKYCSIEDNVKEALELTENIKK